MTNPVETQAAQVIVNKMTQAQYDQITPSDTEFYLITDAETPVEAIENQNPNENPVKAWTGTQTEYDEIGTYYAYTYNSTTVYVRKATPTTSDTVYSAVGTTSALTISSVGTGSITLSDSNTYTRDVEEDTVDLTQYDDDILYDTTGSSTGISNIVAGSIVNSNTFNNMKVWSGNKAQYEALEINNLIDNNTLYNITDDTDVTLTLLNLIYPVGSIYIGTMQTCPLQTLGIGTWQLVATDRVLQGAGTRGSVGSTVEAGLPNITGVLGPSRTLHTYSGKTVSTSGAFKRTSISGTTVIATGSDSSNVYKYEIDASSSSSIYGNSNTVQQDAYLVNIWERIS